MKTLAVADLSNIEGRKLAWFADERWKLEAFRAFDAGTGPDLYNVTAASILGGDPWTVPKRDRNVFGKVPDLSCLAEGQLVTTDCGAVPIEYVTREMRVWDGLDFVRHGGRVYQGVRQVIEYGGLVATPDHRVFVEGCADAIEFHTAAQHTATLRGAAGGHGVDRGVALRGPSRVYDILNAGPRNRFTVSGVLVHNCGYQGGVTGFQTFARVYGVRMADHWATISLLPFVDKAEENFDKWGYDQIEALEIDRREWVASEVCKLAWRDRHPKTRQFWYDLQGACEKAIRNWGQTFSVGRLLKVRCVALKGQRWMVIRLPSGRHLTYFDPQLRDGNLTYLGMGNEGASTTRAWVRLFTHGGKLTGNCCQASARDILFQALPRIEAAGYPVVLTVHDEVVAEVDASRNHQRLVEVLSECPDWAAGLPLAAAGFTTTRYRKD